MGIARLGNVRGTVAVQTRALLPANQLVCLAPKKSRSRRVPSSLCGSPAPWGRRRIALATSNAHEVKALSPHHRFVIALHSPDRVAETGLRARPPEKKAAKARPGSSVCSFLRSGYALRYALGNSEVRSVTSIGRKKLGVSHPKLNFRQLIGL